MNESETVYVLEGEFESVVGGHGRRILLFAPGGVERFFVEASAGGADLLALAERYGWRFVV